MMRGAAILATVLAGLAAEPAQLDDSLDARLRGQTQALLDALASGDRGPWRTYLDAHAVYTDEDGGRYTKDQMVAQVTPVPKGVSFHIDILDWRLTRFGDTAVDTHNEDQRENFHGQILHALYRVTDTWVRQAGGWRLAASQVLAMRQDPPAAGLPGSVLQSYTGRYAAGPDYVYEISREGPGLVGRANGGKPQPLKAEVADVLFTPGEPRTREVFQRDAEGRVVGFLRRRDGHDVVFKRLDGPSEPYGPISRQAAQACPRRLM
jgi:hypothetical protein